MQTLYSRLVRLIAIGVLIACCGRSAFAQAPQLDFFNVISTPTTNVASTEHTALAGNITFTQRVVPAQLGSFDITVFYGVPITNNGSGPGQALISVAATGCYQAATLSLNVSNAQGLLTIQVRAPLSVSIPCSAGDSITLSNVRLSVVGGTTSLSSVSADMTINTAPDSPATVPVISPIRPGLSAVGVSDSAEVLVNGAAADNAWTLDITEGYVGSFRNQTQSGPGAINGTDIQLIFTGIPQGMVLNFDVNGTTIGNTVFPATSLPASVSAASPTATLHMFGLPQGIPNPVQLETIRIRGKVSTSSGSSFTVGSVHVQASLAPIGTAFGPSGGPLVAPGATVPRFDQLLLPSATDPAGVVVQITNRSLLTANPALLAFQYQVGGTPPAPQQISVTANPNGLPFTASATATGANWLAVQPVSGSAGASPVNLLVSVSPGNLSPGTYTGTISVTSTAAANSPRTVAVTLTIIPAIDFLTVTSTPTTDVASTEHTALAGNITFTQRVVPDTLRSFVITVVYGVPITNTGSGPGQASISVAATGCYQAATLSLNVSNAQGNLTIQVTPPAGAVTPCSLTSSITLSNVRLSVVGGTTSLSSVSADVMIKGATAVSSATVPVISLIRPGLSAVGVSDSAEVLLNGLAVDTAWTLDITQGYPGSLRNQTQSGQGATNGTDIQLMFTGIPQGMVLNFDVNGTTIGNTVFPASSLPASVSAASPTAMLRMSDLPQGIPSLLQLETIRIRGTVSTSSGTSFTVGSVRVQASLAPIGTAFGPSGDPLVAAGTLVPRFAQLLLPSATDPAGVVVQITNRSFLTANPALLAFQYQGGGTPPAPQQISVTANPNGLPFTASATTATGANWLAVQPVSGSADASPVNLLVSVSPGNLAPGIYTGTISVTSTAAANSPLTVAVTLTVNPPIVLTLRSLPSSSNGGEMLTFTLGPNQPVMTAIPGCLILDFAVDTAVLTNPAIRFDDPMTRFTSAAAPGRRADFTLFSNQATLPPTTLVQTGTTAGTLSFSYQLQPCNVAAAGPTTPLQTLMVNAGPPQIERFTITPTTGGLTLEIRGFSSTRQLTSAQFRFEAAAGRSIEPSLLTQQLETLAAVWYQNPTSALTGTEFTYSQPIAVQGDLGAIRSISVTLTNLRGSSAPASTNIP